MIENLSKVSNLDPVSVSVIYQTGTAPCAGSILTRTVWYQLKENWKFKYWQVSNHMVWYQSLLEPVNIDWYGMHRPVLVPTYSCKIHYIALYDITMYKSTIWSDTTACSNQYLYKSHQKPSDILYNISRYICNHVFKNCNYIDTRTVTSIYQIMKSP